jgi:hypothetical protein
VDGYLPHLRSRLTRCREIASGAIAEFWNDWWLLFNIACFVVPLAIVEVVLFIAGTGTGRVLSMVIAPVLSTVFAVVWAPKDS